MEKQVNYNEDDYINGDSEIWERASDDDFKALENEDLVVETYEQPIYNKTVKLQSRISARVKIKGPVSGKLYEFANAGAIVEVDEEDILGLLAKRLGEKPCCGGNPDGNKVFELIE